MEKSMGLNYSSVLGIPITLNGKERILEYVKKVCGMQSVVCSIFTPNPEIITYAQTHQEFKRIVASAQINIPDGWGVVWALRRQGKARVSRYSGVDLMQNLCALAADQGFKVGFFGGRSDVALKSYECLKQQYTRLEGEVLEAPELESGVVYIKQLVEQIKQADIRILFVALGFPKQEYFIEEMAKALEKDPAHQSVVLMAVGGSFDYLSGTVPRAPLWLRERGGEWLYRLIREPWRWQRQVSALRFFIDIWLHE